jgi:hypothetical protein
MGEPPESWYIGLSAGDLVPLLPVFVIGHVVHFFKASLDFILLWIAVTFPLLLYPEALVPSLAGAAGQKNGNYSRH